MRFASLGLWKHQICPGWDFGQEKMSTRARLVFDIEKKFGCEARTRGSRSRVLPRASRELEQGLGSTRCQQSDYQWCMAWEVLRLLI